MRVKFFGQPNMLVKMRVRVPFETHFDLKPVLRFDENGEFITDDEALISRMKEKFDSVPLEDEEEVSVDKQPTLLFRCRKCGDGFETKGKLLAHSRKCGKVEQDNVVTD